MLDLTKDILIPITAPSLTTEEYGKHIGEVFDNIWKNFQTIINLDYLKGAQGDSIITKSVGLNEISDIDETKSWGEIIQDLIKYEYDSNLLRSITYVDEETDANITVTPFSYLYNELGDLNQNIKLTLIYRKDNNNEEETLISSLPFVFLDHRFNHRIISLADSDQYDGIEDCTCIINVDNGELKILKTYPTLYYDKDNGNFCWKINSVETGLLARGPMGSDGRSAKCHVIKCRDVINNNTIIYKKLYVLDNDSSLSDNWVKLDKEIATKLDIQSGDLSFIMVERNPGDKTSSHDFYISNIWEDESNEYYTVISNNSIYTSFLTDNFKSFLSNINISSQDSDSLRGLYIPMCPDNSEKRQYVHIICATPTVSEDGSKDDIFSENINFNIIPTTEFDNVNSDTVMVRRAVNIYKYGANYTDEKNIFLINYKIKHTDYSTLKSELSKYNENLILKSLRNIYGLQDDEESGVSYTENYIKNYISTTNPAYIWKDNNNNLYISNALNLYNNEDIAIYGFDPNESDVDERVVSYSVFENESYILNTTIEDDYKNNTSLNFGYNSVYFGTKSEKDEKDGKDASVNVNINGNLHVSDVYSNNSTLNHIKSYDIIVDDKIDCSSIISSNMKSDEITSHNLTTNKIESNNISSNDIISQHISANSIESSELFLRDAGVSTGNDISSKISFTGGATLIEKNDISTDNILSKTLNVGDGGNIWRFFAGADVKDDEIESQDQERELSINKSANVVSRSWSGWSTYINNSNIFFKTTFFEINASSYGAQYIRFDKDNNNTYPIFAIFATYKYRRTRPVGNKPWYEIYTGRIKMEIDTTNYGSHIFETDKILDENWIYHAYWGDKDKVYTRTIKSCFSDDNIDRIKYILDNYNITNIKVSMSDPAYFKGSGNDGHGCGDRTIYVGPMRDGIKDSETITNYSDIIDDQQYYKFTYLNPRYIPDTDKYPKVFLNNTGLIIKLGSSDNETIKFNLGTNNIPQIVMGGKYIINGVDNNDGVLLP